MNEWQKPAPELIDAWIASWPAEVQVANGDYRFDRMPGMVPSREGDG